MTRKYLAMVLVAAMVVTAGCTTASGYQTVGDAKVDISSTSVTLSKGETAELTLTVANSSDVEWVTFNVLKEPKGLNTRIHGKKVSSGESTTLTITSKENVEMMPIMVRCGKATCVVMVPSYDGHGITVGMVTSGNTTGKMNVSVSA